MDGDNEVQAGKDRRESGDEDADRRADHVSVGIGRAERRVERPTGIDATGDHRGQGGDGAEHVDVPAQQVHSREGQVFGAHHQGNQEIPQRRRHRRDQEEKHHDDPVHGKQLVIGVGRNHVARRSQQLQADQHGEEAADPEHGGDRDQVEQRDTLMVCRQQPRLDAVVRIQVVLAFDSLYGGCHVTHLRVLGPYCTLDVSEPAGDCCPAHSVAVAPAT